MMKIKNNLRRIIVSTLTQVRISSVMKTSKVGCMARYQKVNVPMVRHFFKRDGSFQQRKLVHECSNFITRTQTIGLSSIITRYGRMFRV